MDPFRTLEIAQIVYDRENGVFSNNSLREMVELWLCKREQILEICGHISQWNVSQVTAMDHLFSFTAFNDDISQWDTGNVTTMEGMFSFNMYFNQDISGWNIANVINMQYMFENADGFCKDLSSWRYNINTNTKDMFYTRRILPSKNEKN